MASSQHDQSGKGSRRSLRDIAGIFKSAAEQLQTSPEEIREFIESTVAEEIVRLDQSGLSENESPSR